MNSYLKSSQRYIVNGEEPQLILNVKHMKDGKERVLVLTQFRILLYARAECFGEKLDLEVIKDIPVNSVWPLYICKSDVKGKMAHLYFSNGANSMVQFENTEKAGLFASCF